MILWKLIDVFKCLWETEMRLTIYRALIEILIEKKSAAGGYYKTLDYNIIFS